MIFYFLESLLRKAELRNKMLLTDVLLRHDRLADTTFPAREKFLSLAEEVAITENT